MPASAVAKFGTIPPQVTGLYGTIWRGRAALTGGYALNWDLDAAQLLRLRAAAAVTLEGPDTRLEGAVGATPWSVSASNVTGRAGPGLLSLIPGLVVANCTSRAVVDVRDLRMTRTTAAASGVVSVDAGSCDDALGRPTTVPQMTLDLSTQDTDARAVLSDGGGTLAAITVAGDRRLIVRVEPEGATLIPGMPTSGPIIVEYPF